MATGCTCAVLVACGPSSGCGELAGESEPLKRASRSTLAVEVRESPGSEGGRLIGPIDVNGGYYNVSRRVAADPGSYLADVRLVEGGVVVSIEGEHVLLTEPLCDH